MRVLSRFLVGSAIVAVLSFVAQAAPFAYITNGVSETVSVIDTATDTVVATVRVGSGPIGVAVNPERHAGLRRKSHLEQRLGHRHRDRHCRRHDSSGHDAFCARPIHRASGRGTTRHETSTSISTA